MIAKILEHTTRNISFSTDELKPWTEEDEQLISAYTKLHDHEQHLKDLAKPLQDETKFINDEVEEARQTLANVEKQIKELSELADSFILPDPKKEDKATRIFDEASKVYDIIIIYQHLIEKLEENVAKFCDLESEFLDSLEDFSLWDEYNDVSAQHAGNYAINSIDIVSFDLDEEYFKAYIAINKDSNYAVYDHADRSVENFNALMLETKIQYATWEELTKRVHLIRQIVESSGTQLISSAN
jgi:hypothetical protein